MAKTKILGHIKFGNPTAQSLLQQRKESVENPPSAGLCRLEEIAHYYDSPEEQLATTDRGFADKVPSRTNNESLSERVGRRSKVPKKLRKWTHWGGVYLFFKRICLVSDINSTKHLESFRLLKADILGTKQALRAFSTLRKTLPLPILSTNLVNFSLEITCHLGLAKANSNISSKPMIPEMSMLLTSVVKAKIEQISFDAKNGECMIWMMDYNCQEELTGDVKDYTT